MPTIDNGPVLSCCCRVGLLILFAALVGCSPTKCVTCFPRSHGYIVVVDSNHPDSVKLGLDALYTYCVSAENNLIPPRSVNCSINLIFDALCSYPIRVIPISRHRADECVPLSTARHDSSVFIGDDLNVDLFWSFVKNNASFRSYFDSAGARFNIRIWSVDADGSICVKHAPLYRWGDRRDSAVVFSAIKNRPFEHADSTLWGEVVEDLQSNCRH